MAATNWTGSIRIGETEVQVKMRPAAGRESAAPESGRRIEVCEFIKTRKIDPVFLERSCYLEPAGPARGYYALVAALRQQEAEGVCIWTLGKRACLASLRAAGKSLRLNVLRYADSEPETSAGREEGPGAAACLDRLLDARAESAFFARALAVLGTGRRIAPGTRGKPPRRGRGGCAAGS